MTCRYVPVECCQWLLSGRFDQRQIDKRLVFKPFSASYVLALDINTTHSTWLDCSRLMSDFSSGSREFIKACFFRKTHRFLPLCVLGNRSKALLLPIICKRTDLPTASRLRSEGTSLKSHRLNSWSGYIIREGKLLLYDFPVCILK